MGNLDKRDGNIGHLGDFLGINFGKFGLAVTSQQLTVLFKMKPTRTYTIEHSDVTPLFVFLF